MRTLGPFHANSTSASIGTILDFAQNCTKCVFMGAMKIPKFQTKIPSGLDFMTF